MQPTITSERAMLLVAALVDAVRRHVEDRKVLAAIGDELGRIYGGGGGSYCLGHR